MAHPKAVAVMRLAGIEGPQACPKGRRHGFGIAAVTAGVLLPTIAAVLGQADIVTTAIYMTGVGVEARGSLAKMWDQPFSLPSAVAAGVPALLLAAPGRTGPAGGCRRAQVRDARAPDVTCAFAAKRSSGVAFAPEFSRESG